MDSSLAAFVVRRLLWGVVVVLVVMCLVFVLGHAVGDPTTLMLAPSAPHSEYVLLRHHLGLDRPLSVQFVSTMGMWLHGNFGQSLWMDVPALPLVLERLPRTLYLAAAAMLIAVPLAVVLGGLAGIRPGSIIDKFLSAVAALTISIAQFWLGLLLILVFAVRLRMLPPAGYGGLRYVILPAIALSLTSVGRLAQVTRSAVLAEREKLYVDAARARGASELSIFVKDILRNASIPVLTLAGTELASMVNGAVVIETVFSWPGIGLLLINAIEHRDLPVVEACVFIVAGLIVCLNIVVDVGYALLDPRVRR
jgi:peptide/nickel transport system permease protein